MDFFKLVVLLSNINYRHLYKMKNNYDPVDIESIDKTEFWIVEEEEDPPLLDYDELEQMLNEDGSTPQSKRQCNRPQG